MAVYQKPQKRSVLDDIATIFGIALQGYGAYDQHKQAGLDREADVASAAADRSLTREGWGVQLEAGRDRDDSQLLGNLLQGGYEYDPKQARGYQPEQRPSFTPTSQPDSNGFGIQMQGGRSRQPERIPDLSGLRPQAQLEQGAWNKPPEPDPFDAWVREKQWSLDNPTPPTAYEQSQTRFMDAQTDAMGRELETTNATTQAEYDWDSYWQRYNEHERNVEPREQWMMGNQGGSYEQYLDSRQAEFFNFAGQPPGVPERQKATVMQFVGELMLGDEVDYAMYMRLEDGPMKWAVDEQLQMNNFDVHEKFGGGATETLPLSEAEARRDALVRELDMFMVNANPNIPADAERIVALGQQIDALNTNVKMTGGDRGVGSMIGRADRAVGTMREHGNLGQMALTGGIDQGGLLGAGVFLNDILGISGPNRAVPTAPDPFAEPNPSPFTGPQQPEPTLEELLALLAAQGDTTGIYRPRN